MAVAPIPKGYHTVTAYLIVNDAAKALDFYKKALGAEELFRFPMPDGKIAHAEMKIGDSIVMLADAMENFRDPHTVGGTPVTFMVYVPDVDRIFAQAIAAGATQVRAVENQFYGDRLGTLTDPFGHVWSIATHVEDVSPEELSARHDKLVAEHKS